MTRGMTGSSIAIVPPPAMTTSAVMAMGRCVSTRRIGADRRLPLVRGATIAKTTRSISRHRGDDEKRQADAADLIQPSAKHRAR